MSQAPPLALEICQPFQRREAWHEEILPATQHIERLDVVNAAPDRLCGNRERRAFLLKADNRIPFLANSREISVVNPLPLQELQSGHRLGAEKQEMQPARDLIVAVRERVCVVWRSVSRAAPDDAMEIHIR